MFNLADLQEQIFGLWEKYTSEFSEILFKNPVFLANMGKLMEGSNFFKKHIDDAMEFALKNMRIPTSSDMDKTLAAVHQLEGKVNELTLMVEKMHKQLEKHDKAKA